MKSKKLKVGALALALVFAMSGSVFAIGGSAAGGTPGSPTDAEYAQNGDTVFSIFESAQNAGNMSYTIPLYVTMAVSKDQTKVAVPDNYGIINNSIQAPGDKMDIGITGLQFEKLPGSTYETVAADPTAGKDTDIMLKIGGVVMPTLNKNTANFENMTGSAIWVDGDFGSKKQDGPPPVAAKPTPIAVSQKMHSIKIEGTVKSSSTRKDKAAAAQFRVKYNVALLDQTTHMPIGAAPYAGSNYQQAGLPDWDYNKTTGK